MKIHKRSSNKNFIISSIIYLITMIGIGLLFKAEYGDLACIFGMIAGTITGSISFIMLNVKDNKRSISFDDILADRLN